jgi:hypothetical protein
MVFLLKVHTDDEHLPVSVCTVEKFFQKGLAAGPFQKLRHPGMMEGKGPGPVS